jgi:hypothetical protein
LFERHLPPWITQSFDEVATKEVSAMKKQPRATLARREFLRTLGAGVTLVAAAAPLAGKACAATAYYQDRSKARYQPNSPEVQNFYRVNRYPAK